MVTKAISGVMSRRTVTLSGLALLGGASATPATAAPDAGVTRSVEALRKAMVDADKAGLDHALGKNLSFGHSNGLVQTKDEFMAAVLSRKEVFKSITLTDQTVNVIGNNAIVRQTFASDLELEGKPLSVKLGELQIWLKVSTGWRLIARQAFKA
jgi:hypothetical protein